MTTATRDEVVPGEKWEFDAKVADAFDDMLERSIPQYEVMRQTVNDLAARYYLPGTAVVDLGCSRGAALAGVLEAIWDRRSLRSQFLGVEISPPMAAAARERLKPLGADVVELDLRKSYPSVSGGASVTLAVLTLQFTPIEHRQRIVRDAFRSTALGGVLILVEKVLGATADLDSAMVDLYYDQKREKGYSDEAIERKRLSLEGVLVPVTARWNEEILRGAGFDEVDCFWRWCNFAGWAAVRTR